MLYKSFRERLFKMYTNEAFIGSYVFVSLILIRYMAVFPIQYETAVKQRLPIVFTQKKDFHENPLNNRYT